MFRKLCLNQQLNIFKFVATASIKIWCYKWFEPSDRRQSNFVAYLSGIPLQEVILKKFGTPLCYFVGKLVRHF